jgi:hypothetical protein
MARNLFDEVAVDSGINLQYPTPIICEPSAFYRVLLGHDDGRIVAKREIRSGEGMVIRKRVGVTGDTQSRKTIKESLRIADCGDGMHLAAAKM